MYDYDIFISFDGKYRELAEDIYEILVGKYNLNVFIDNEMLASDDKINALEEAIDKSRYMLVLYSKEFENNKFCIEEFKYSDKIKKIIFIVDDIVKEIKQNILKSNKKEDDYLIKGRFQESKKISKIVVEKIANENIVFDFKKEFSLEYTSDKILFKRIINSYILIIFSWLMLIIGAMLLPQQPQKNMQTIFVVEANGSLNISKQQSKNLQDNSLDLATTSLVFLFTIAGAYWFVFFQLYKEYIKIVSFFNKKIDFNDIKYLSFGLILSVPAEFILNASNGATLLSGFGIFLYFIIFLFPLYIGWLSSFFINYKISYINKKFILSIKNYYFQYIKVFTYEKIIFENSSLKNCINKEAKFTKWYLFLVAIIFMAKDTFFETILPIKYLKFCEDTNTLYIDEDLKKYINITR